jgi:hypothetical protein
MQSYQRTLVPILGMFRTQMGSTIDHKMVADAWDALYDASSGIWWKYQELSHVDIIPPWFCMFIYHLGGEQ